MVLLEPIRSIIAGDPDLRSEFERWFTDIADGVRSQAHEPRAISARALYRSAGAFNDDEASDFALCLSDIKGKVTPEKQQLMRDCFRLTGVTTHDNAAHNEGELLVLNDN